MNMAEKKTPAAEAVEQNDAPVATATAQPATHTAGTGQRFGRGILIGAGAAALVVGLAVGGVSGFAIAHAVHRPPIAAGQGEQMGDGGVGQLPGPGAPPPQGPGQHGPGQFGQGQHGPGQHQQGAAPQGDTQQEDAPQEQPDAQDG
jgi:hypothetical protein